jgi:hypothetical protein
MSPEMEPVDIVCVTMGVHLAYSVVSAVMAAVNVNAVDSAASEYHPPKVLPAMIGEDGIEAVLPESTF